MSTEVHFLVEWSIPEAGLAKFKELAHAITERVEANEPRTMAYQWYLSDDGRTGCLLESYEHPDAIAVHMQDIGHLLGGFNEVATITRFTVLGDLTEAAQKEMAELHATFLGHMEGMSRWPGSG